MAISNKARPSMRGLRSAFGNATNGIRDQWEDFKDRHKSVKFLSEKANQFGGFVATKARHFGNDFVAGYHAFRASYDDRHLSGYLEKCKADLEEAGFSVSAGSERAEAFSKDWEEKAASRAAAEAAWPEAVEAAEAAPAAQEAPEEEHESLDVGAAEREPAEPEQAAPAEPESPSASGVAGTARSYADEGISSAAIQVVTMLNEYQSAPEDERNELAFAKALQALAQAVADKASADLEAVQEAQARRVHSDPAPSPEEKHQEILASAGAAVSGLEDGPEEEGEDLGLD